MDDEGKTTLHSECKMTEAKPNECVNNDFRHLSDEKFDFDFSLSPISENEDEVFVGPMGHKEKCIATTLEALEARKDTIPPSPLVDELKWSPVSEEKFVEIFKEAHQIAVQIQSGTKAKRNNGCQLEERKTEAVENFVQESKSKLKLLEKGIVMDKTPKEVRRETYCVYESPVSPRPPSFQKHSRQLIVGMDSCRSPQIPLNTSSPARMSKLPPTLLASLAQGKSVKTNNKLSTVQTVKNASAFGNSLLAAGQPKQGKLPSISSWNNLSSMESSEDLLSDKSSLASDAGDASFSNSSTGKDKRTLSTSSKLGIKATQLKRPSNIRMRRNTSTSSSSSSFSSISLNSSQSISPKIGKGKIGVASKVSARGSRLSSTASKIAIVKPMKGLSVQASHSDVSGKEHGSTSASKANLPVNAPKYRVTDMSEMAGGILKEDSDPSFQKPLQKSILGNRTATSSPKPKAVPAVSKEGVSENFVVRVLQPIASLSCGNVESNVAVTPPRKLSEDGLVLNTCSAAKSALWTPSNRRHSALPTPIGRRTSGIPSLTPRTVPKARSSPDLVSLRQVSSVSSKKTLEASFKWARERKTRGAYSSSSTEGSPPPVAPIALDFSTEKSSEETEQDLSEQEKPAERTPTVETLLIDIGIDKTPLATQECENKPLIDLFNTPEIIPVPLLKPVGQPIDLSSPLISFTPEGNKENLDSPLLKF
uniref:G2 and S phase-expressed protein 1 isoform X1 n=1 Tax=Podarcis muralis TaxID=64176 RepID=UPI00109F6AAF|nr:G2 and S phase-expressed protein 1 isoform X1 [Podarcis muralis]XP_028602416.1 G2 and S phase-expressed protein 1 isoform X1 [Podarcis muralis]XP_028602418.1 G2 and S phase-expressed protein 1 isoform X1 [Podarcis muralis]